MSTFITFQRLIIFAAFFVLKLYIFVSVSPATAQEISEADTYFQHGIEYHQAGQYDKAEYYYKLALKNHEIEHNTNNQNVPSILNNLALIYKLRNKYNEAEKLYNQSIIVSKNTLGENNVIYAGSLTNLGLLYVDMARYSEAEKLLRKSLTINERLLGSNHPNIAITLRGLAAVYKETSRFSEAENLIKKSISILQTKQEENPSEYIISLQKLAEIYRNQARLTEALKISKTTLEISKKISSRDPSQFLLSLNTLGNIYTDLAQFDEAEKLYINGYTLAEKVFGENHETIVINLKNLAGLYILKGRYSEAEKLYERSSAIEKNLFGINHPKYAETMNNYGSLYYSKGEYQKASRFFKTAIDINENIYGNGHLSTYSPMVNLAQSYRMQGKYSDAEKLYQKAINISNANYGQKHLNTAIAMHDLAILYTDQERYADGEALDKKSLEIANRLFKEAHPFLADINYSLGREYYNLKYFDESNKHYQISLNYREKIFGQNNPYTALTYGALGLLSYAQGAFEDAQKYYEKAFYIYDSIKFPKNIEYKYLISNMVDNYNAQNKYRDAYELMLKLGNDGTIKRDSGLRTIFNNVTNKYLTYDQGTAESFKYFQLTVNSSISQAVSNLSLRYATGTDNLANIVRSEQDLYIEKEHLNNYLIAQLSKPSNQRNTQYENELRQKDLDLQNELNILSNKLLNEKPQFLEFLKPQGLTLKETQQLLAEDEAVVALSSEKDNGYAWVITKADASWIQISVKSTDMNAEVSELRQSLTFSENGKSVDKQFNSTLAFKIYQQTLGPIADKITGKKRLSIVANGALTSIPLGLLVSKDPTGKSLKDTDWLIKSYAITVLPSIYSLKTMRAQAGVSSATKPMIAFADPVFSKAAQEQANQHVAMRSMTSFYNGTQIDIRRLGEHLPQLPNTRDEVQNISKALGAGTDDIKLGLQATEKAVKQAKLDEYRIVYFATHGLVAGELEKFSNSKAEPALALTIPNQPNEEDNGLLQASEIAQLKLNADWAVLSACNTASSDGVGAEALSGLARAFIYAGARSLVVSNWDVSDDATKILMTSLFEISFNNKSLSHGEALQKATLQLLNNAKTEEEAHPRYWAPFIVVGEPAI